MFKQSWIVIAAVLVLAAALSACGNNELAGELTAIPTLPPGEEPALVEALAQGVTPAEGTAPEAAPDQEDTADQQPDLALGEQLFAQNGCAGCHAEQDGVGPALTGMGDRAITHAQDGQSPEEYLIAAIAAPCDYVVEGYQCIMQPYDFTDHEMDSLVAWLQTHTEADATSEAEPEESAPEPEATEEPASDLEEATETPEEPAPAASEPDSDAEPESEEPANVGDPANGETVWAQNGCAGCHGAQDSVGPALPGMGDRAAEHAQEGQTAAEYLHAAIVAPCEYVVEGYQCIMQPYDLPEQELNDLVAYLLEQ